MRRGQISVSAAMAAAVLTFTGCGASGSGSGGVQEDAFTLVTTTASKTVAAKTAKAAFVVDVNTTSRDLKVNGAGVVDFANNALSVTFPLPASSGISGSIDEVLVKGILYLRLPEDARAKTGGHEWVSIDPAKLTGASKSAASSYNQDLTSNLTALRAASRKITVRGTQRVRGVETTHYHALIDLQRAWKLHGIRQETIQQYQALLGDTLPEDVYLDAQGRTRRVEVTIKPEAGSAAAGELKSESVSIDFYDFGKANVAGIVAPPKSQTIDFSKTPLAGG